MKIAIFGGSFNPVHNEHILMAEGIVKELNLDKLLIMPTAIAPHKQSNAVVSGEHRLNMLNLAFKGCKNIEVSSYELDKGGISYSYQTVEHIKQVYNPTELYFLMGSDMLENFPTWKNPEKIIENATLVLCERRNGEFQTDKIINRVETEFNTKVIALDCFGGDISSTKVRVYKMLGLSLENLVPKAIENYIDDNDLYQGDKYYEYIKNALPIKRKVHTAGVILTALKYAKTLGVDKVKAELSALLHDVAKYELPENYPDLIEIKNLPEDIVHQYLGYYIAKNKLGVLDEAVLSAIKYHTTGRSNMSNLEILIYVSDLLEPSRKFSGVEGLRAEIDKDFSKGFVICLEEIVEFLKRSNKEVYPLTLDALNYYKGEIL